ncbi:prephenate dehydratase domain-containing protein [Diaphorobacter sp. HDW4A]|uniref:prephenate dehydratase domain-containing protein n=1 Tax=Diaphorobacter sp. HDW4A TaxID=2714924 RepID=UPI001F0FBFAE|nr:prephenate dehydratase domain-containing protein [Diaphorobacter sp. HDW4A]
MAPTTAAQLQSLQSTLAPVRRLALLGPAGTWTHQAALELWPAGCVEHTFMDVAEMRAALLQGRVDAILLPARTSIVGATPYMPLVRELLALDDVVHFGLYARMLGYCLLACSGVSLQSIRQVHAHPVALVEAALWLDGNLPHAQRVACASAGEAAAWVAVSGDVTSASLGPALAGQMHGLIPLVEGIEEGPHNVTEWWVVGRSSIR